LHVRLLLLECLQVLLQHLAVPYNDSSPAHCKPGRVSVICGLEIRRSTALLGHIIVQNKLICRQVAVNTLPVKSEPRCA
jgi:hypothetical protein